MLELERRWKVQKEDIPFDKITDKFIIEQTYANFDPDLRVRKISKDNNDMFFHTAKYFLKNNKREEIEQKIDKEQYDNIFDYIGKNPIQKERMIIPFINNLKIELDYFYDTNEYIAEVEFEDETQMKNFEVPKWFGKEITDRQSYNVKIFKFINKDLSLFEDIQNSVKLVK